MRKRRKYRDNDEPTNEGFIGKLFSATAERLPAHVSEEQDWYMDTPDVRLARVFTIVLILHVVAVGGILAFKMIDKASAPGSGNSVVASDAASADQEQAPAGAVAAQDDREIPVTPAPPDPLIMQDPTRAGLQQYLVSRGETIESIASDLKLDASELKKLNSIHVGNQLYPGQWIAIPKREEVGPRVSPSPVEVASAPAEAEPAGGAVAVERPAPSPQPTSSSSTYVVQKGDTPYGIARQFGMTPEALMAANGISKAESLQVGATLNIPGR